MFGDILILSAFFSNSIKTRRICFN